MYLVRMVYSTYASCSRDTHTTLTFFIMCLQIYFLD
uniref:Uncharacterized protein n=1 Tax=Anguilla anguilla TaxID=7936 RepID=A0A0E9WE05_ANGAN